LANYNRTAKKVERERLWQPYTSACSFVTGVAALTGLARRFTADFVTAAKKRELDFEGTRRAGALRPPRSSILAA